MGIFPYVLKLLQTTAADLRQTLVFIWTKIMAWDANSQVQSDLIKDGGHLYFIKHLESQDESVAPESKAQAAFVLAAICNGHPKGQLLCAQSGLLQVCISQLPGTLAALAAAEQEDHAKARTLALLVKWLVLCAGKLCEDMPEVTAMALREQVSGSRLSSTPPLLSAHIRALRGALSDMVASRELESQIHETLVKLLAADDPEIRAAAVFALGGLIQVCFFFVIVYCTYSWRANSFQASFLSVALQAREVNAPSYAPDVDSEPALLPDNERMVIERAIICALLEVVYDGSPMVRCDFSRFQSGMPIAASCDITCLRYESAGRK